MAILLPYFRLKHACCAISIAGHMDFEYHLVVDEAEYMEWLRVL